MTMTILLPAILLLFLLAVGVQADEHTHEYAAGEDVIVWANTVGPRANRQETYEFYQLPYCQGTKVHDHRHETLGEALQGQQLVNSGLELHFRRTRFDVAIVCWFIVQN